MPIDVLICNAGLAKPGMIGEVEVKDLDLVTKTNFLGCVYPIHAVVPLMKQRSLENPSSIVIMSSLAGLIPVYGVNVYSATKYALKGLAEVLYLELLPWNIHVNLICPSFTKTDLLAEEYFGANATICGVGKTLYSYNQQSLDSADHVAKITLEGIKAGRFLTFTNRQGSTLGPLGRGFIPSDSFSTFFLELLLMIPYRFLNVLWLLHSKKVIMSSMNSNMN
ncbi:hypothetical protein KP509_03G092800 [Ceratopteris richardii]|nr:hypothetical protein KP509_03G092800 [Ceratopteris richardii]